ncbi:MAG: methyltransferase [Acidobacteria bacterium]|nr:methyltransferase [Acidobacteriota bacterium]
MTSAPRLDLAALRRFPDVEAANLFASDSADRLLLDTADALEGIQRPGTVALLGDHYGALTLGALDQLGAVEPRVYQDLRTSQLALAANAESFGYANAYRHLPLGPELLSGVSTVLLQLPRSLAELDQIAAAVARYAASDVVVLAGGRIKHMSRGMNSVLEKYFGLVSVGLARQKARVLSAYLPRADAPSAEYPQREFHADLDLWVHAHGAVFAGTSVDIGTRFLLDTVLAEGITAGTAVDLGCGSGIVAAVLAKSRTGLHVTATDRSEAAVASAMETAKANGVGTQVTTVHDDAASTLPAGSTELVVLNPPFHLDAAVHAGAALKLFDAAARLLAPGGELWTVYNRHLDYAAQLERRVGPTRVVARNPKFSVAVSVRRS